eukprot:Gb_20265 [translate_table: standard]
MAAFVAIMQIDIPRQQPLFPLKTFQSHLISYVRGGFQKKDTSMLPEALNQTMSTRKLPTGNRSRINKKKPSNSRVAICLVGGARKFELTGPSLLKYVLNRYNNSDVFLHSPFDKDSHKFSLLKDSSNLAAVRIFTPQWITETSQQAEVLTSSGSPNGLQEYGDYYLSILKWVLTKCNGGGEYGDWNKFGFEMFINGLLQYFNLVEGCLTMIKSYQSKHKVKYDWVVRTRVDGYWNGPLPPLESFSPKKYIVPPGSQYGGLNDRLGIGNLATSEVALSRITLIPFLHSSGYRNLNSETAFKHQLDVKGVEYKFRTFPFCILSERKYVWPPSRWGVPVASLSSRGHLNGAKCRPCTPVSKGPEANEVIETLIRSWSWTPPPDGLELCDAHDKWEEHWEDIFNKVAGPKLSAARKKIKSRSITDCVKDFETMKQKTGDWDAPSSTTICKKAFKQSQ